MEFVPVVGYDEPSKVHRPLLLGSEAIPPQAVPLSAHPENKLLIKPDGLYVGKHPSVALINVDPDLGLDDEPPAGATAFTCKSLDFALALIEISRPQKITVRLKSGRTHIISHTRYLSDVDLILEVFGEPTFGTCDVLIGASKLYSQYQSSFVRPIIAADMAQDTLTTNCWYIHSINLKNSKLFCKGIMWSVPGAPFNGVQTAAYSVHSDMLRGNNSEVYLDGTVVNKIGASSNFGFLGIESRSLCSLYGYSSQFTVENALLSSPAASQVALANRIFFIKLLPDWPSANTVDKTYSLVPTALGPTASSALLNLHWTQTQALADTATGSSSLPTFPNATANYGIGNYIYGVVRDQQRRAINVRSNIPI